ncbi:BolA/IbaG family iron-sulfur metabolism protein [Candidatus Erwinia haradaeae]|uniref:DNA-binding transcriptional regulator BolA n=1 Tax=Candidatus Erwinia haradaeae TaxID=1922217 RepID=A0A451DHS3_9GAMM|nr:BolA/IbaG family iron-sulfur metabolism protein [Candidatus Erwinia haradaeae]VFP86192.1 DNA-binding transcriptional regulator BolA [Candidatus Erwinia haradaeae]
MNNICNTIEDKLFTAFAPEHLKVYDESRYHSMYIGLESHFKVLIVSKMFHAQEVIKRHRAIYKVLAREISSSVHSLSLKTYSCSEWATIQHITDLNVRLGSPRCLRCNNK